MGRVMIIKKHRYNYTIETTYLRHLGFYSNPNRILFHPANKFYLVLRLVPLGGDYADLCNYLTPVRFKCLNPLFHPPKYHSKAQISTINSALLTFIAYSYPGPHPGNHQEFLLLTGCPPLLLTCRPSFFPQRHQGEQRRLLADGKTAKQPRVSVFV